MSIFNRQCRYCRLRLARLERKACANERFWPRIFSDMTFNLDSECLPPSPGLFSSSVALFEEILKSSRDEMFWKEVFLSRADSRTRPNACITEKANAGGSGGSLALSSPGTCVTEVACLEESFSASLF